MSITKDFIIDQLKEEISGFKNDVAEKTVGRVLKVSDGIALVSGLSEAMMSEILIFKTAHGEVKGVALNLEENQIGAIILGEYKSIKEGDEVLGTKRILEVPVGEEMVGRVVNPLGEALDGKGSIKADKFYPVEKIAPGVITRASVKEPVQTGIKAIDAMIPIGRGQRELIIGDRQLGKTALAIDAIINQKGQNMKCIYVAIGQKESKVANIVSKLEEAGAMDYTTIVLAGASSPASLLYIAPYSGCAMGNTFWIKARMSLSFMMIFPSTRFLIVKYRFCSAALRDAKLILVTFFIYIPVFWKELVN
jgi:F-type H+-transporting ATPase subunit alpha